MSQLALAQTYTYQTVTLPTITQPTTKGSVIGIVGEQLLAEERRSKGFSAILSGTPLAVAEVVTCPVGSFVRSPTASRGGPQAYGFSASGLIAGAEEGVNGLYGFVQALDGTCQFTRVPGSVGTLFTGINDLGSYVGYYWNSPSAEPGIKRFHGLITVGGILSPLAGPAANDIAFPVAVNSLGDHVGYLYRNVQSDNTYEYQAYYNSGGVYTFLDSPDGDDLFCAGLNNAGQVVCYEGNESGSKVDAFVYDVFLKTFTALPKPTPTTTSLIPLDISDTGVIVGQYVDKPNGATIIAQFIARPQPSGVALRVSRALRKQRVKRAVVERIETAFARFAQRGERSKHFRPVQDASGNIVLTDGERILGQ